MNSTFDQQFNVHVKYSQKADCNKENYFMDCDLMYLARLLFDFVIEDDMEELVIKKK